MNKLDWIIPLVLSVLYFVVVVFDYSRSIYVLFALLAALYYILFRLFTNKQTNNKLFYYISCFICAAILAISAVYLLNQVSFYRWLIIGTSFANLGFMLVSFTMKNARKIGVIHFCFQILAISVVTVGYSYNIIM